MALNHFRIILFFLVVQIKAYAQASFIEYPQICDFIFTDNNGLIYLSSLRGLYVYNGTEYPFRLKLEGIDNQNIQSSLYPDDHNGLWFTTYNRIVRYDKTNGNTESYQIVVSPGDTIISNYYLFDIDEDRKVFWIKSGNKIYEHNTVSKKSNIVIDSITGRRIVSSHLSDSIVLLDCYYTISPSIIIIKEGNYTSLKWINWPAHCMVNDLITKDSNTVLIATNKGLFEGNIRKRKVHSLFFNEFDSGILAIAKYTNDSWILATKNKNLFILNWVPRKSNYQSKEFRLFPAPGLVNRILRNDQGTLFLSSYDHGIFYFNPENIKFNDYQLNEITEMKFRNTDKNIIKNLSQETEITDSGVPFICNDYYLLQSHYPYTHSILNGNVNLSHPGNAQLYRYFNDEDGDIYASFLDSSIYKFTKGTWNRVDTPKDIDSFINFYYNIGDTLQIASVDQMKIITWNSRKKNIIQKSIYSGDVYSAVFDDEMKAIFLGTEQGLLKYNIVNQTYSLVDPNNTLPCYCLLLDKNKNIWYSSIQNIFMYSPKSDSTAYYDISDGSRNYSIRKCSTISSDSLLFYYPNGATLVIPSMITPKKVTCFINFLNLKINDGLLPYGDKINYIDRIDKIYEENTISFDLFSNDLIDATNTRIKYRLDGYDNEWIISEGNTAFVRYPRLPPGSYKFKAFGKNSDGIWNTTPRELFISIKPPFWMTWWFIILVIGTAMGLAYYTIRSYYNRKLQKKNLLLREQALVIEKQQAIEYERTRIASEMHDDLGSGLTTIRYLSDRALKHAKDSEEVEQIKRISEHSNNLVQNMSEIIWAMNSRFDNAESLAGYLRRYASEFLNEHHIDLRFEGEDANLEAIEISGEKRRNLFLVFKEILHNAVKYSGAHQILIQFKASEQIQIIVSEKDGRGFNNEEVKEKGNGLFNCERRMTIIGGNIHYEQTGHGTDVIFTVPLTS